VAEKIEDFNSSHITSYSLLRFLVCRAKAIILASPNEEDEGVDRGRS